MSLNTDTSAIKYLILPSTGDVALKFVIVMGIMIGFMVALVYTSLTGMKFVPNIHMFYDMLFDNFETSGNEMMEFIETVVRNTPAIAVNESFGNMTEIPLSSPHTASRSNPLLTSYTMDTISDLYDRAGDAVSSQFNKMMTKSYVRGNTIRTTRSLK